MKKMAPWFSKYMILSSCVCESKFMLWTFHNIQSFHVHELSSSGLIYFLYVFLCMYVCLFVSLYSFYYFSSLIDKGCRWAELKKKGITGRICESLFRIWCRSIYRLRRVYKPYADLKSLFVYLRKIQVKENNRIKYKKDIRDKR